MKKVLYLLICFFAMLQINLSAQSATATKDGFYNSDKVQEIRLKFDQKNWPELLDSLRIYGNGHMIGEAWVNGKKYKNIGVRYRGSRSFKVESKRNAFHIKLDYIKKDQNHQGYETIKLSNALRDPSMIREVVGYEIARKYMPAPEANHARLYINDEYYGLFINLEAIDDKFLEAHFGDSENTFVKCSPNLDEATNIAGCKKGVFASLEYDKDANCYMANYEMKSDEGWDDLIELTNVLNNKPEKISDVLNVDRTLWMLAYNNVLVNLSSYSGQYSQNYYLYKDATGRFNPIIWDLNLVLGSYKNTGKGSDLDLKGLQQMDPLLHIDNPAKPLVSKLLENEHYKKIYLSHIRTIVFDNFVDDTFTKRCKDLQRTIQSAFVNDKNKFYTLTDFNNSLTTTIGKRSKIPGLGELMIKRGKFLKKHKAISVIPPEVTSVEVLDRGKFSNKTINNFNVQAKVEKHAKQVKLRYRFSKEDDFKEAMMKDDGKSNDGKAGDGVYGISINPSGKSQIEYYIQAENSGSVSFYPPNYMFEPYTTSMKDLNK